MRKLYSYQSCQQRLLIDWEYIKIKLENFLDIVVTQFIVWLSNMVNQMINWYKEDFLYDHLAYFFFFLFFFQKDLVDSIEDWMHHHQHLLISGRLINFWCKYINELYLHKLMSTKVKGILKGLRYISQIFGKCNLHSQRN